MAITIQHKRDTAANWTSNNPTLAAGEFGFETDTGKFKAGDGSTAWSSLGYFATASVTPSYCYQGSSAGYHVGGVITTGPPYAYNGAPGNIIDKYPFSSDANATDVGDLTECVQGAGGIASDSDGYRIAGHNWPFSKYGSNCVLNANSIDKMPFASEGNSSDVGDVSGCRYGSPGAAASPSHGYFWGGCGYDISPTPYADANISAIRKFEFAAATYSDSLVGLKLPYNPSTARNNDYSQAVIPMQSTTHAYSAGGAYSGIGDDGIVKFPFSTDTNATEIGDLAYAVYSGAGASSDSAGYVAGGNSPVAPNSRYIQCHPFASDANAACVGLLSTCGYGAKGTSSASSGYAAGVGHSGGVASNIIEKWPFSGNGNSTDVGDLTVARGNGSRHSTSWQT